MQRSLGRRTCRYRAGDRAERAIPGCFFLFVPSSGRGRLVENRTHLRPLRDSRVFNYFPYAADFVVDPPLGPDPTVTPAGPATRPITLNPVFVGPDRAPGPRTTITTRPRRRRRIRSRLGRGAFSKPIKISIHENIYKNSQRRYIITRRVKSYIIVLYYNIIRGVRGDIYNIDDAFLVDLPVVVVVYYVIIIIIIFKPPFV